jgi:NAD(P)-dependent dehydrogenase (short-subunit alcohol dehydrogenase family)
MMKIFIAGGTGVIGRNLLPRLTGEGHEVTAITRSQERVEQIRGWGARPVVCDVFDQDKLKEVVAAARPEAVIHQLTNLPHRLDPRQIKQALAQTNRLRTEGTQILRRRLRQPALAALLPKVSLLIMRLGIAGRPRRMSHSTTRPRQHLLTLSTPSKNLSIRS